MRAYMSRKSLMTLAAIFAVLILSVPGEAQRRRGPRARGYTKGEINELIKRVENRSDDFVRVFDSALDRSRLDGTRREDRLNSQARKLEETLDDLRREFDRKESYIETRPEVSRALNVAGDINRTMRGRRMGGETERTWAALRAELNTLANAYNLAPVR